MCGDALRAPAGEDRGHREGDVHRGRRGVPATGIFSILLETLFVKSYMCPQEKIEIIAKETYKAGGVEYLPQAEKQIELYTRMGFSGLPICMAKTQACVHALDQP